MRRIRHWSGIAAFAIALSSPVASAPTRAAAPSPPLDACLSRGSFAIGDPECLAYAPEQGNQFGPIAGIEALEVERGMPFTLSIPGGSSIDFGPPQGQQCGERGCPSEAISWRRGSAPGSQGVGFLSGCGATDITCEVVYAPPTIGDRGEFYQVVFGEQYHGITPTGNSVIWALYTPPIIYPVALMPVDTSGA